VRDGPAPELILPKSMKNYCTITRNGLTGKQEYILHLFNFLFNAYLLHTDRVFLLITRRKLTLEEAYKKLEEKGVLKSEGTKQEL
jgi:hypothetical protein